MDEGNHIRINPVSEEISSFNIYKETDATDRFELIGQTSDYKFFDSEVNTWERSYKYVVTAIDECENESEYSDAHRTMHLTVNEGNLGQINLIWDGYQGIDYDSYKIYRGSSADDLEMIASVPSYLYTYTDLDPSIYTQYYQIWIGNEQGCGDQDLNNGRQAGKAEAFEVKSNLAARYGDRGHLTLSPNPASERVKVSFSPDGNPYQVQLLDNAGRKVRIIENVTETAFIDRGDLPSGIYTVMLSNEDGEPAFGKIVFE